MEDKEKLALVEAVLFSATEPLSLEEIRKITRIKPEILEKILEHLKKRYAQKDYGIYLIEIGGYKLTVKPEFAQKVSGLAKADLPKGLLRVLSIIAYHEPVKQADIVKIIGNRTYEYVKQLQEMGFVVGEKKGKTKILKTTPQFESYFGTRKEDLKKIMAETEQKETEEKKEETSSGKTLEP